MGLENAMMSPEGIPCPESTDSGQAALLETLWSLQNFAVPTRRAALCRVNGMLLSGCKVTLPGEGEN